MINRLYPKYRCGGMVVADHYSDVIMSAIVSQITSVSIVCSTVCETQRKHQSSAQLAFVMGIHRWPVDSPDKWPVMRKMCPFYNVIMGVGFNLLLCIICIMIYVRLHHIKHHSSCSEQIPFSVKKKSIYRGEIYFADNETIFNQNNLIYLKYLWDQWQFAT